MDWEFIRLNEKSSNSYAKRSKIPIKPSSLAIMLILLGMGVFDILKPVTQSVFSLKSIDPNVLAELNNSNNVVVYISASNKLHNVKCIKQWKFGNLIICKSIIHSKAQLFNIIKTNKIISIFAQNKLKITFPIIVKNTSAYSTSSINLNQNIYYKTMLINQNSPFNGNETVAIVDTGIDYLNPYLYRNNKTVIKALVNCMFTINNTCIVNNTTNFSLTQMYGVYNYDVDFYQQYDTFLYEDQYGHGTFVAGEIVSQNPLYKGFAPNDSVVIIKAFDKNGTASEDWLLNALQWLYNNIPNYNITVLSFSWGSPSRNPYDPVVLAINKIYSKYHVAIFVAAGNDFNVPGTIESPAISKDVFAVGSWDCYRNELSWFSSIGPTYNLEIKPDFVACGSNIVGLRSKFSSDPCFEGNCYLTVMSGTSMATPLAAACYSRFVQYYEETYHKSPTIQDFVNYEKVNAIKHDFTKDFIEGYGFLQCP